VEESGMSRLGDLEDAIVTQLAEATSGGSPVFAVVRGFSGGYRPALRDAIKRERMPAAYVAFTREPTAPEMDDVERGARFVVLVATQALRAGDDPRHGDVEAHGAFAVMDRVRAELDNLELPGDVLLQSVNVKHQESDDRVAIYELAYRAWPIFITVSKPGETPLIVPRMIGTTGDHILFDPAQASYLLTGAARPTQRLMFQGLVALTSYNIGSVTATQLTTNAEASSSILAVQVAATNDGGWRSLPILIPEWCDVSEDADIVVPVQAVAAASGNLSLRVNWDRARAGTSGISEGNVANVVAGPTAAGDIAFVVAGTIPGGTFETGDCLSFAVQRLGASDTADTYTQDILLARFGWISFKRNRL
jgi:hypothetical protein